MLYEYGSATTLFGDVTIIEMMLLMLISVVRFPIFIFPAASVVDVNVATFGMLPKLLYNGAQAAYSE